MEAFAKKLASSDGSIRDKAFKALRKWLTGHCIELDENDYLCLWKALFYCMWMADKPSYQAKLAKRLADIWKELEGENENAAFLYVNAFWMTICREWNGIDRYRLDKFYMLVKCFYTASFAMSPSKHETAVDKILSTWPLNATRPDVPDAIRIYFLENFTVTLKTVDGMEADRTVEIIRLYIRFAAEATKPSVLKATENFFASLSTLAKDDNELDLEKIGKLAFEAGEVASVLPNNRRILYAAAKSLQKQ